MKIVDRDPLLKEIEPFWPSIVFPRRSPNTSIKNCDIPFRILKPIVQHLPFKNQKEHHNLCKYPQWQLRHSTQHDTEINTLPPAQIEPFWPSVVFPRQNSKRVEASLGTSNFYHPNDLLALRQSSWNSSTVTAVNSLVNFNMSLEEKKMKWVDPSIHNDPHSIKEERKGNENLNTNTVQGHDTKKYYVTGPFKSCSANPIYYTNKYFKDYKPTIMSKDKLYNVFSNFNFSSDIIGRGKFALWYFKELESARTLKQPFYAPALTNRETKVSYLAKGCQITPKNYPILNQLEMTTMERKVQQDAKYYKKLDIERKCKRTEHNFNKELVTKNMKRKVISKEIEREWIKDLEVYNTRPINPNTENLAPVVYEKEKTKLNVRKAKDKLERNNDILVKLKTDDSTPVIYKETDGTLRIVNEIQEFRKNCKLITVKSKAYEINQDMYSERALIRIQEDGCKEIPVKPKAKNSKPVVKKSYKTKINQTVKENEFIDINLMTDLDYCKESLIHRKIEEPKLVIGKIEEKLRDVINKGINFSNEVEEEKENKYLLTTSTGCKIDPYSIERQLIQCKSRIIKHDIQSYPIFSCWKPSPEAVRNGQKALDYFNKFEATLKPMRTRLSFYKQQKPIRTGLKKEQSMEKYNVCQSELSTKQFDSFGMLNDTLKDRKIHEDLKYHKIIQLNRKKYGLKKRLKKGIK